jgi:hypothetical protein
MPGPEMFAKAAADAALVRGKLHKLYHDLEQVPRWGFFRSWQTKITELTWCVQSLSGEVDRLAGAVEAIARDARPPDATPDGSDPPDPC